RYRDGVVPADRGDDGALAAEAAQVVAAVTEAFEALDLTRAADEAWVLVRRLNRLVEERAPWRLARDDAKAAELDQALASLAEGLRITSVILWPYMPGSSEAALRALGQDPGAVGLAGAVWGRGIAGARVEPTGPLFPKVEDFA
ncbi:MAG: methionine--tRNA ligase, partial [Thermoleophilia bacterium]|nr:methionine--tRNA ligase [Thermoleophilia bacterium]